MTPDEFVQLCECFAEAESTGNAVRAKTYFNALWIGANRPHIHPPENDDIALEGYKLGIRLMGESTDTFK